MLKSVTVRNYTGEETVLELSNPWPVGLAVVSIDGIDPGKANVNMTEVATNDGGLFNSARISTRNITLNLLYLDNMNIEETRHRVYKMFPLKRKVTLIFHTDIRDVMIEGYTESNEVGMFTSKESSKISIVCETPYFTSVSGTGTQTTEFSGEESLFEFDVVFEEYVEFSVFKWYSDRILDYLGDASVGVNINIIVNGPATGIRLSNITTGETMRIDSEKLKAIVGSDLKSGDVIKISTVKGFKGIYFVRDGSEMNILNALDKKATWFQLALGENRFAYSADTGFENLAIRIENQIVYEGV